MQGVYRVFISRISLYTVVVWLGGIQESEKGIYSVGYPRTKKKGIHTTLEDGESVIQAGNLESKKRTILVDEGACVT